MEEIKDIKGFKKIRKKDIKQQIDEGVLNEKHLSIYDIEDEDYCGDGSCCVEFEFKRKADSLYVVYRHGVPAICMFYKNIGDEPIYQMDEDGVYKFHRCIPIEKEGFYAFSIISLDKMYELNESTNKYSYLYDEDNLKKLEEDIDIDYIKSILVHIDRECIVENEVKLKLYDLYGVGVLDSNEIQNLKYYEECIDSWISDSKYYQAN